MTCGDAPVFTFECQQDMSGCLVFLLGLTLVSLT